MKYKYKARFFPTGYFDPTDASQAKEAVFTSDNRMPAEEERKKALISLQKKMDDAYVARNYWELHDYFITYKNPPWNSTTKLRRKLNDFTAPRCKVRVENKKEKFFGIEHKSSVNPKDISDYIESCYNVSVHEEQVEEVTNTVTKIYVRWNAED